MTKQEIFNKVWLGLSGQNWRKSRTNLETLNTFGAMRGKNGLKCAIGHIIPDDRYRPEFEGKDIDSLSIEFGLFPLAGAHGFESEGEYHDFLQDLMSAHDSAYKENFQPKMKQSFIEVASHWGLEIPQKV